MAPFAVYTDTQDCAKAYAAKETSKCIIVINMGRQGIQ
jgi:hypothetical protein